MSHTATVSISVPKKRYWPNGWERPEQMPQFQVTEPKPGFAGMQVLQGDAWVDVPSQAALHIRVQTCEAAALRRAMKRLMHAIDAIEHDGSARLDEALREAGELL